jgi:hypothetical protein
LLIASDDFPSGVILIVFIARTLETTGLPKPASTWQK